MFIKKPKGILFIKNAITTLFTVLVAFLSQAAGQLDPSVTETRGLIERYELDLGNLKRFYKVSFSETSLNRIDKHHEEYQEKLAAIDFERLNQASKIDYLLFKTHLHFERKDLKTERERIAEVRKLVPWIGEFINLIEERQSVEPVDAGKLASYLFALNQSISKKKKQWQTTGADNIDKIIANRSASLLDRLNSHLSEWYKFYDGYNPVFSWWVKKPYEKVKNNIQSSSDWLRKEVAGYKESEDAPLLGDPIGREALLDSLAREWIPYSPEELIKIAQMEMAWCLNERKKAAKEMGYGDDWKAAQDAVKSLHVGPGEQPQLIKKLAKEAEQFLDERDILTIPEIARETWRMNMMSAARQKFTPYFTGGEVISVSYPTDEMDHNHKLMSMRGNNVHFSKATVHHELIPGHHLQGYMARRYNPHRDLFKTPFFVEGWALYWEMLLWDQGFADSPEDKIGMLFWRSHRCARIIFSLSFHLGLMSPEECIDFLVENVGHERRNATAEVRRSIQGGYSPLYQAAYMLGGLQLKQLSERLVGGEGWTWKKFHDAVLIENSIPMEFVKASLEGSSLKPDSKTEWKFYPGLDSKRAGQKLNNKNESEQIQNPRAWRDQLKANWYDNHSKFWYRLQTGRESYQFVNVTPESGERKPAFDHSAVAKMISEATGKTYTAKRLPITELEFINKGETIKLKGKDQSWILDTRKNELKRVEGRSLRGLTKYDSIVPSGGNGAESEISFVNQLKETVKLYWVDSDRNEVYYHDLAPGKIIAQHTFGNHVWAVKSLDGELLGVFTAQGQPAMAYIDDSKPKSRRSPRSSRSNAIRTEDQVKGIPSPDKQWIAFVKDHNLYVRSTKNNAVIQLTDYATEDDSFGQNGQREKFMSMRYEFKGYPDYLPKATWSPNSKYLVAHSTTKVPEHLVHMVQSSPRNQTQPKLHTIPYFKPGDPIPSETPHLFKIETGEEISVSKELFPSQWRLGRIEWSKDSKEFLFPYNQRGHQVMRIIAVETGTGKTRAVVDENCETFFDYAYKYYWNWLKESDEAIWMSESDGWNHLYLIDVKNGKVKNQITKGEYVVRRVVEVNSDNRTIMFTAGGYTDGEDPYHLHYFRVNFDGSGLTQLTKGDGTHSIEISPDKKYFIDKYSRVDMAAVHELRDLQTGELVCHLETGDVSEFEVTHIPLPQRFVAKGRDGKTDIYGIIHWPRKINRDKQYPVIESIYAGPHSAHVPKSFRNSYRQRQLVDMGFIVVQIDGMGTSHRSKAFHDVCWKNIVDAGFPDRIAWIKSAAQKYPFLDISKVGIYGGSAGGQNTLAALLTFPDFYKVGVADCGCHDNRMDKIWWNELWMSYPIEKHYEDQSNVTLAKNLEGDLLLLLGEMDKNVDPASTMQVVNALINSDKEFDMLVMPNVGHGAAGTRYGWNKLKSFFKEKILDL